MELFNASDAVCETSVGGTVSVVNGARAGVTDDDGTNDVERDARDGGTDEDDG